MARRRAFCLLASRFFRFRPAPVRQTELSFPGFFSKANRYLSSRSIARLFLRCMVLAPEVFSLFGAFLLPLFFLDDDAACPGDLRGVDSRFRSLVSFYFSPLCFFPIFYPLQHPCFSEQEAFFLSRPLTKSIEAILLPPVRASFSPPPTCLVYLFFFFSPPPPFPRGKKDIFPL